MYSCNIKKTLHSSLRTILKQIKNKKDQTEMHSPLQKNDGNGPLTDWRQLFKQLLFIALSIK